MTAVLSLGKLCEDHGYSCEWVSGHKPRLTKKRERHLLQDRQFRTSCRSRAVHQSCKQFVFIIAVTGLVEKRRGTSTRELVQLASSSSSSSVFERSDGQATRRLVPFLEIQNQNEKRRDRKNSKDPLADLPDWLQDFKENLKETELHASRTQFSGIRSSTSYEIREA